MHMQYPLLRFVGAQLLQQTRSPIFCIDAMGHFSSRQNKVAGQLLQS